MGEKRNIIRSKEYPGVTINQAIEFVNMLKEFPMNKPLAYEAAAKTLNTSVNTKSFKYKLSAAKQYGLISTSSGKNFSFLEAAKRFVFPHESEVELKNLKKKCFSNPTLYNELIKDYEGKALPSENTLSNILISQYGIAPAASANAAATFLQSADQAGVIVSGVLDISEALVDNIGGGTGEEESTGNERVIEPNTIQREHNETNIIREKEEITIQETFRIPLGGKESASLHFPENMSKETAQYLNFMIYQMLKNLYGID